MRLQQVLYLVNCHTEGMVCDVLVGGVPKIPGSTMMEKKQYFLAHLDHLRTLLLHEPVPPEYSIVGLTCCFGCGPDAVMVGCSGASED